MATITIQPTGAFAQDATVAGGNGPNASLTSGLGENLTLGGILSSDTAQRIIIEFPLRGIPPFATISSATLTLYLVTPFGAGAQSATLVRLARPDWDQVSCSWTNFRENSAWITPGAGDVDTSLGTVLVNVPGTAGPFTVTGLETLVQDALQKRAQRLIIRIRAAVESSFTGTAAVIASGQNSDWSKAPKLDVTYDRSGIGNPLTTLKRAISSWVAGRPEKTIRYMAVGIAQNPVFDPTHKRLTEEIYRKPVKGITVNSSNQSADVWALFDLGEAIGTITEVGLFAHDSTTLIDRLEVTTGWSGGGNWTISGSTTSFREGAASLQAVSSGATSTAVSKITFNVNLTKYNLDDWLQFWVFTSNKSNVTTFSVSMTDGSGTWTWSGLQPDLIDNNWQHYMLQFDDATKPAGVTGPGILGAFSFAATVSGATTMRYDHIRVIKDSEELLAYVTA